MKKALIITYYWVPNGGAGVQRWIKFVKYLRQSGWEPVIYTPKNPDFGIIDHTLENDIPENIQVIRHKIWEPYHIYRKILARGSGTSNASFISQSSKSGWKDRLSIWIRGNFFIPDPRTFWVRPSIRFLKKRIKEEQFDIIISTGPPHSMHLIAAGLKIHFSSIPWLADFRDPWTNIDFYKDLNLTCIADYIHHRLERKVLRLADGVTVVSEQMKREFQILRTEDIKVIPNGYDDSDIPRKEIKLDEKFTISHIGTLNKARNPITLWKCLEKICREDVRFADELRIQLVGTVDFTVIHSLQENGLVDNLIQIEYLSHARAIEKQCSSQVLLLLINRTQNAKGILTGKLFEYMATGRPIIGIGPTDGDAAAILNETDSGIIVDYVDEEATRSVILSLYEKFKQGTNRTRKENITKYSREQLTKSLGRYMDELVYRMDTK